MNKNHRNSLLILGLILAVTITLSFFAYKKYQLANEEGLVYVAIFKPNPNIIEFNNVLALSKPSICESSESNYKEISEDTIQDFLKANNEGTYPTRLSILEGQVPIVSWNDTKRLHDEGIINFFWPEGHKLLYLSRVGFNKSKTEAVLCIEEYNTDYALNALGSLIFLNKIKGKWKVIEYRNIWVS